MNLRAAPPALSHEMSACHWAHDASCHAPCNYCEAAAKAVKRHALASSQAALQRKPASHCRHSAATQTPRAASPWPIPVPIPEFLISTGTPCAPVTLPCTLPARLALGARALLHLARQRCLHALILLLLVQQLGAQVRNLRLHVRVAARARRHLHRQNNEKSCRQPSAFARVRPALKCALDDCVSLSAASPAASLAAVYVLGLVVARRRRVWDGCPQSARMH